MAAVFVEYQIIAENCLPLSCTAGPPWVLLGNLILAGGRLFSPKQTLKSAVRVSAIDGRFN